MDIVLTRIISLFPKNADGAPVRGCKKALADALGLPSNIFMEWASGKNKSYLRRIPQIADYFGVSVSYLTGETDKKNPNVKPDIDLSDDQLEAIERIKKLSPEELARKMAALRAVLDMK